MPLHVLSWLRLLLSAPPPIFNQGDRDQEFDDLSDYLFVSHSMMFTLVVISPRQLSRLQQSNLGIVFSVSRKSWIGQRCS